MGDLTDRPNAIYLDADHEERLEAIFWEEFAERTAGGVPGPAEAVNVPKFRGDHIEI